MSYFSNVSRVVVASVFAGAVLLPLGASAASQCRGMAQDACAADTGCSWIEGYTRKDGRSVSAHCRTRSGKKTSAAAGDEAPRLGQVR